MNYDLIQGAIQLVSEFEDARGEQPAYSLDVEGFKQWIADDLQAKTLPDPDWPGMDDGRSAESAISTLLVHMNRYAKSYSKSAIHDSSFSTQEDFIYLINLKAFGAMSKMDLIKKNIHEKPVGMQIINRLISNGWIIQRNSLRDKRSKEISITEDGLQVLANQMDNIRKATQIVSGNLTNIEKMELIRLLQKLESFHHPIYTQNMSSAELLSNAYGQINKSISEA